MIDRVTAVGACARAVVLSRGRKALEGTLADLLGDDTSPSLSPLIQRAEGMHA